MNIYKHISDYLFENAKSFPAKPALITRERTLSWEDLAVEVRAAAAALSNKLPASQPQMVGLFLPDSWQFVVSYLAIVHLGHIAMPVDITFKKLEVDFVLSATGPKLIIVNSQTAKLADGPIVLAEDLLSSKAVSAEPKTYRCPADQQIATLFLSSGTTGRPKAIPNTHANQMWDVAVIAKPYGWSGEDNLLITLHLAHRHGLVICLLGALYHGNTVYLEERFNPASTLELLESGKISIYSTVPSAYEALVEFTPGKKFDLSRVRLFASSSSPMPPYLAKAFKARFGQAILDRYGTSETGSIAIRKSASDEDSSQPIDDVELRIEPSGEVAMRSPGVFPGYYKNPQATKKNLTPDGWWLTGDIGQLKNGRLILRGRSKERISRAGYSIYPQDIEWALKQNPAVTEVKITHQPSQKNLDDVVVAFFVGQTSEIKLQEFSQHNLPRSWRPDFFIKIKAIPKTPNGKPSLVKLKKILASQGNLMRDL